MFICSPQLKAELFCLKLFSFLYFILRVFLWPRQWGLLARPGGFMIIRWPWFASWRKRGFVILLFIVCFCYIKKASLFLALSLYTPDRLCEVGSKALGLQ